MSYPDRLSEEELAAWQGFLRAHHRLLNRLDHDLRELHQIPIEWYDVLYQVNRAGGRLTMSELAEAVLITPPNCTRVVDRMVTAGYLRREPDRHDARIRYAVLTMDGLLKLREASPTHVRGVRGFFTDHVDLDLTDSLAGAFDRVVESLNG